jgi:hypothetical protein
MNSIKTSFDLAKVLYDRGQSPLSVIHDTVCICLDKLGPVTVRDYGGVIGKNYSIFEINSNKSRPVLLPLFFKNSDEFSKKWSEFLASCSHENNRYTSTAEDANTVLYTAVMAFAVCYDLWKPSSRKTPGTFFEILLGSLISQVLPRWERSKFITLPALISTNNDDQSLSGDDDQSLSGEEDGLQDTPSKVSTDIVFNFNNQAGIVIPAKITTRERIVQPFAHQRILDSAVGLGKYVSLLACVSETQRDDKNSSVNEICVPGTIELFQRYLAKIGGIYYLDPPERYLRLSIDGVVEVSTIGGLITGGFEKIIKSSQINQLE